MKEITGKMKKMITNGSHIIQTGASASLAEGMVNGVEHMPAAFLTGALTHIWDLFLKTGNDFSERNMSTRESVKVGALFTLTAQKLNENFESQKSLRTDNFFEPKQFERSSFEEIAEGALMVCQREYEEKKIKYMANLLANISCDETISKEIASQLIRLFESLSYRQLLLLGMVGVGQTLPIDYHYLPEKKDVLDGYNVISIYQELLDLFHKGLIRNIDSNIVTDSTQINLRNTKVIGIGVLLHNLTEITSDNLNESDHIDRMRTLLQVHNCDIPDDLSQVDIIVSKSGVNIQNKIENY